MNERTIVSVHDCVCVLSDCLLEDARVTGKTIRAIMAHADGFTLTLPNGKKLRVRVEEATP